MCALGRTTPDRTAAREIFMSTLTEPVALVAPPRVLLAPPVAAPPRTPWLVSPWFDLFFLANLTWPIVLLVAVLGGESLNKLVAFGMVYVLITPHRWITLTLVFFDGERFRQRP